jgi:hypothetical protein
MRLMVDMKWNETEGIFSTFGAEGEIKWGNGKVSAVLRMNGPPAKWFEQKIVYETRQMLMRACSYARTGEIEAENKESLRQCALETYRQAYLNELEAAVLIGRWQAVDEITKVLAALTSSGSAVAGWLLWKQDESWKRSWAVMAGAASVLSIAHVALKVSDRVKDWSDTKGHFVRLRTELETFLYQMKVNPAFPLDAFVSRFEALRTRFGEGVDRKKVDPLAFGIRKRAESYSEEKYLALKTGTTLQAFPLVELRSGRADLAPAFTHARQSDYLV